MSVFEAAGVRWARARERARHVLWRLHGTVSESVTVTTRQGRLTVYTADQIIGRTLFVRREFEYDWALTALRFLRDQGRLPAAGQGTFLDIGANMGVISIGMMTGGEFARAIAMEPDPRNFKLLQRNARQNGLLEPRYVCLPYAASDRRGELAFELSRENFGDHRVRLETAQGRQESERFGESGRPVIRIAAAPVDELLAARPTGETDDIAVVWVDTQGHEGHVFRGGSALFARDIPVVAEVWPYGLERAGTSVEEFSGIASRFWSAFCLWRQNRFEPRPIAELSRVMKAITRHDQHENVVFLK